MPGDGCVRLIGIALAFIAGDATRPFLYNIWLLLAVAEVIWEFGCLNKLTFELLLLLTACAFVLNELNVKGSNVISL